MGDLGSIGEFSELSRLSVKALRNYDELGLLRPASVDPSTNYRSYAWWQLPTARLIVLLRSIEVPLEEIRQVLEATAAGRGSDNTALLSAHRRRLSEQLARSEQLLDTLDRLISDGRVGGHSVVTRVLDPELVLAIREESTLATMGNIIPTLLHEVKDVLERLDVVPAGPPFLVSPAADSDTKIEIMVGLPIAEDIADVGRCRVERLDGGLAVTTTHIGPYTTIEPAYQALTTWMQVNNHRPVAPPREVYFTNTEADVDPSRWRTEVIWPVAAHAAGPGPSDRVVR